MKKNIFILLLIIITVSLYFLKKNTSIIKDVKIYKSSTSINDLDKGEQDFSEIDRSRPESLLFGKTLAKESAEIRQIYSSQTDERILDDICKSWKSEELRQKWRERNLLFSFKYEGDYSPPYWFCFFKSKQGTYRPVISLESENNEWRQSTNIEKYPSIIAFYDIAQQFNLLDATTPLTPEIIRDFIDRCQQIDEIITERMQTDPDYYNPVQDGPY